MSVWYDLATVCPYMYISWDCVYFCVFYVYCISYYGLLSFCVRLTHVLLNATCLLASICFHIGLQWEQMLSRTIALYAVIYRISLNPTRRPKWMLTYATKEALRPANVKLLLRCYWCVVVQSAMNECMNESTVWVKKIPPEDLWQFFQNRWEFFNQILHAYYAFQFTLDY